ncbi:MAG: cytochrome B [Bradyrhizobium sp.]|nr:MAG: cytochrome B [Bradyrhizobium sp.]
MRKPAKTDQFPVPANLEGARVIRVWDPLVRVFHWTLVLCFVVAWFSAQAWESLHDWAGYTAGSLVIVRVVWGLVGGRYARFSQFVRSPRVVIAYLKSIASGSEARFIGHNPAGAAMIVALIIAMAAAVLTGWMLTTDALWGVTWAQRLHSVVAHGLLLLVLLHLVGVSVASVRHRENLPRAMFTGDKRAPEAEDVA